VKVWEIKTRLSGISSDKNSLIIYVSQIFLAVVVGNRALNVGTDTFTYATLFEIIQNCQCLSGSQELGFEWFSLIISLTNFGTGFYFTCISLVIFMMINLVISKIVRIDKEEREFNDISLKVVIISAFLVSPFFVSAHINAIRQGLAAFFVFYALLSVLDNNWKGFIISGLIGVSIHSTSIIYLGLFPVLFLPFRVLIFLVTLLSIIYAFGAAEVVLQSVSDVFGLSLYDTVVNYRTDVYYRAGVRYDFLFFSWIGIVFALLGRKFVGDNESDTALITLTKVYILLIIPFLLFGFANFSNRYAYTAWLFLSILIPYTAHRMIFWKRLEKILLPGLIFFSPGIFLLMVMNGFAR